MHLVNFLVSLRVLWMAPIFAMVTAASAVPAAADDSHRPTGGFIRMVNGDMSNVIVTLTARLVTIEVGDDAAMRVSPGEHATIFVDVYKSEGGFVTRGHVARAPFLNAFHDSQDTITMRSRRNAEKEPELALADKDFTGALASRMLDTDPATLCKEEANKPEKMRRRALVYWCLLQDSTKDGWSYAPVTVNDAPALLLFSVREWGDRGMPLHGFIVHDPIAMRAVIRGREPQDPLPLLGRKIEALDLGAPQDAARKIFDDEELSERTVLLKVSGAPAEAAVFASPEVAILYPGQASPLIAKVTGAATPPAAPKPRDW